jgi:hypothetical protein
MTDPAPREDIDMIDMDGLHAEVVAWRAFSDRFMDPAYRNDPDRLHIRDAFAAGWDARAAVSSTGDGREHAGGDWWTDGAMVNEGQPGDEGFVGDAATEVDAARIVERHNAALAHATPAIDPERHQLAASKALNEFGKHPWPPTVDLSDAILAEYARLASGSAQPVGEEGTDG